MISRRIAGLLCVLGTAWALVFLTPAPPVGASHGALRQSNAQPRQRLVLGVVRNDGILLPFAAYTGRKWLAPWPDIGRGGIEFPLNLASVPPEWWGGEPPGDWHLWAPATETPRPFTLSSIAMLRIGRASQLGIRTSLKPEPPFMPPFELPFPKMGLGVSGDARVTPVPRVSASSPRFKQFTERLRERVDEAEERALGALSANAGWRHPFKRDVRKTTAIELEAWYVTAVGDGGEGGERMSYVEAVKKYPLMPGDDGCGLETFVSGWLHHHERSEPVKGRLKAVVTYCDRRGVSYMLPFGQIEVEGRVHWIVQMSGHDHEWYAVVEGSPGRAKYVAEFQGGWAGFGR